MIVDALHDRDADRGGAGWWIQLEPEVRFGDLLSVPDIAGWRVERVPELPEENPLVVPLPPFDDLSFALASWWSPQRDPA